MSTWIQRFLLSLAFSIPFILHGQQKIDVLHYQYNINLSDSNDIVDGIALISFKALEPVQEVSFDLTGRSGTKGMSLFFPNDPGDQSHIKLVNNKVIFRLGRTLRTNDIDSVVILYKGVPSDGLIISKNKHGKRTFFADNWPNRAHHWLPCVDDPADKATVEFIVTAPSHYQVIANGVQIEETNLPGNKKLTHYKEDIPLPTKVMVIGVAEFAVADAGIAKGNIPVSTWVFPEDRAAGFYDFAIAKDVLDWYIDYIGPFPYKKLANVQSKTIFGGMENAGAIFYHENSATGKREEESLIAHEIGHQWFGDHATEKSFAHLWLSEGFASYLTHVYLESKYGTATLNKGMEADRQTVISFTKSGKRPVVDTTSNLMSLLNANSYQKGSWVLHMLRRQLGDSVFRKSIREYYATYAGKNADTKDLQKIFEKNSGKDLEQFFQQWLYTPVNPNLNITWKFAENKIYITVEQLQASEPFVFPLEIKMKMPGPGNMTWLQQLNISKRVETFSFNVTGKPLTFTPDPSVSLLFEASISQSQ